jgi:hypothetical protein
MKTGMENIDTKVTQPMETMKNLTVKLVDCVLDTQSFNPVRFSSSPA